MQFQSVIAVLSLALAATAAPNPTNPPPTNSCSQGQVTACCDSINNLVGANCAQINVLSGSTCASNQQLACCNAPTGVLAIGPICPNILVPINA